MDPNYYSPPPMAAQKKSLDPKMLIIGVGGLFAIIIAGVLLLASGDGGTKEMATQAVAHETALKEMARGAQNNIVHPDLRKLNADAQLLFSSDVQLLTGVMSAYGIGSVPKEVTEAVADSEAASRLEQARLENRFDSAYAAVLKQKMDAQQARLQELHGEARSRVQPDIETAYLNLQALQESLEKIRL